MYEDHLEDNAEQLQDAEYVLKDAVVEFAGRLQEDEFAEMLRLQEEFAEWKLDIAGLREHAIATLRFLI